MQQSEWKGQRPQRFEVGRRHIRPQNELDSHLQPALSTIGTCGIRTFDYKLSPQYVYKPHAKIFPQHYENSKKQIDLRGKKYIQLGEQKERARPEKSHVAGGQQTTSQFQNRGIRTFSNANIITKNQYNLENTMQQKTRIATYDEQRNLIGTASLGDKAYKYPEYSTNFYHSGGLIPGSTFRPKPQKQKELQKLKKQPIFTKPNWNVKVKMQEKDQQKKIVNAVDEWEQTILKQANPNWNDPDTFFERMEAKKQQKDVKKGGKK